MESSELPAIGPVPRPEFQLLSLPINIRWEVTRRHPYYQGFWTSVRSSHHNTPLSNGQDEVFLRKVATGILRSIGVVGEPPDPKSPFSALGESQLNSAWQSGALQPLTLRGMAAILLVALSDETLATLGLLFAEASCDDTEDGHNRILSSLIALQEAKKPELDQYPDEPFVSINPAASTRQVNEAVGDLLKEWKARLGLSEQRNRADKYQTYLDVWDRREGWVNGRYDLSEEKILREIAKVNGESTSTVNNQYRRAFELIIGHPYSPDLWWRTMGIHKVVQSSFEMSAVSRRRPTVSPTRRPVPESQLGAELDAVNRQPTPSGNEYTYEELVWDVRDLVSKGKSDEEIMQSLGMQADDAECVKFIGWIRSRSSDE